jgi:hypothetical protein
MSHTIHAEQPTHTKRRLPAPAPGAEVSYA